jgi:hypothetical protein
MADVATMRTIVASGADPRTNDFPAGPGVNNVIID